MRIFVRPIRHLKIILAFSMLAACTHWPAMTQAAILSNQEIEAQDTDSKTDPENDDASSGNDSAPTNSDENDDTNEDATEKPQHESSSQTDDNNFLNNGNFESVEDDQPTNWVFPSNHKDIGVILKMDSEDPFDGQRSALLDTSNADLTGQTRFSMLNQIIDPIQLRGKRVRFRAAVKTSEFDSDSKAQLWFRVDRQKENGKTEIGAFDNMGDRPITATDWEQYEIVADVDDDAIKLTVGMLLIGQGKAWLDDASLEVVSEDKPVSTTTSNMGSVASSAPTQPFFNGWLWLAVACIGLMFLSQTGNSWLQRFALRFALVYWLLYSFPTVLSRVGYSILGLFGKLEIPTEKATQLLADITTKHREYTQSAVHWTAEYAFGIEGQLILPNGSGDTTYAFVRLFACAIIALSLASIWTGIYWRKADHSWLRDLLRTYLRYVLALTMLSYGLHKTGFEMTQFARDAMPSDFQMNRTYGESSPMGLLWTFMAASPAYTFFGGLGETIGGLLLVFRRTATLGALVTFGVMANVVMLNFCYDVPVKQYSFHLALMALIIAAPDFSRLTNVLILNRATEPGNLFNPPYTNRYTVWIPRGLKTVVIFCAVGWPVGEKVWTEMKYYQTDSERQRQQQTDSEHLLINRGFRWINEYPFNR